MSENKGSLYDRKKTPMRSFAKVENESRSTLKNRENLSKTKSRNESSTCVNNNNQTIKMTKSNFNGRTLNKSVKPVDRGISEDQRKNCKKLFFHFQKMLLQ